jgi:hypothetical protein
MTIGLRASLLSALALSLSACAYAKTVDPYVQPTSRDAPTLTFLPMGGGWQTSLHGYQDTKNCLYVVPLGGKLKLTKARKIRIVPGEEFAFRMDFHDGFWRCQLMTFFTPETGAAYRATPFLADGRCGVRLSRVVAGTELREASVHYRNIPATGSCAEQRDIFGMPAAGPAATAAPSPGSEETGN